MARGAVLRRKAYDELLRRKRESNGSTAFLVSSGHNLFFYSRYVRNGADDTMEIDFLIRRDRKICPVEVKSSDYREHSSLNKFRRKFGRSIGTCYILHTRDVEVREDVVCLPLYMASLL